MATISNRRAFLADVGRGMIVASVGAAVACDLGLAHSRAWADDAPARLTFGKLEPLVALMQETPPDKLMSEVVSRLAQGTTLKDCVAAAALANARAFGGEDYIGFHTLMALSPALAMTEELPEAQRALPVLKVLYRNASRVQAVGVKDTLKPVTASAEASSPATAEQLRASVKARDAAAAERTFAAIGAQSPEEALNALLPIVDEAPEVHRVVLVHRAWDMVGLLGAEHALTLLRQSLRYCVKNEEWTNRFHTDIRKQLPELLVTHKLENYQAGTRAGDDAYLESLTNTLFTAKPTQAAEAIAMALAEGFSPATISEAVSLAANQLVLRDSGRTAKQVQPGKPEGSVHGDSIGVHASDSANAWRGIARAANPQNAAAALILSGYQVANDRLERGGDFAAWQPRPYQAELEAVSGKDADGLLKELDGTIREQNQARACAVTHRYLEAGGDPKPLIALLCRFATSEDGALHAEKYFRTTTQEFALTRPAFRGRQLVALARVTASEYGKPAPGIEEARKLLGIS